MRLQAAEFVRQAPGVAGHRFHFTGQSVQRRPAGIEVGLNVRNLFAQVSPCALFDPYRPRAGCGQQGDEQAQPADPGRPRSRVRRPPIDFATFINARGITGGRITGAAVTVVTAGRVFTSFTNFQNDEAGFPIMASYSDDGGESWLSEPIFVTPPNSFCQGSQPVYLPDGDLAVVYWNFINPSVGFADDHIEIRISEDGGGIFGPPRLVAGDFTIYDEPVLRGGTFLPSAAADRNAGALFVTYQAVMEGIPKVVFTRSSDKGQTWTTPLAASNNPAGSSIASPAIAVSPDGRHVAIIFYDTRDNPLNGNLFHLYLAESFDSGDTWEPNTRLSETPSNALLAPLTPGGRMFGDYLGVVSALDGQAPAVAIWIDTRTGSPDPFAVSFDRPFPDPFGGEEIAGFPGWNASPWYDDYFTDLWPWVYHTQHGWQWVKLESGPQGIFLFDLGFNEWIFLNENTYRWFFLFGDTPGWVWSFPDGNPEERFFGVRHHLWGPRAPRQGRADDEAA